MLLEELIHLGLELNRERIAAGEHAAQKAQIGVFQLVGAQQRFKQRRHTRNQIRLFLFQQLGVGVDGKLRHQNAGGAYHQRGVNADAQAKTVENWHNRKHLHAMQIRIAAHCRGLQGQGVKVAAREQNTLGGAGRAAGIENDRAFIGLAIQRGKLQILRRTRFHKVVPEGILVRLGQLGQFAALGHDKGIAHRGFELVADAGDEHLHRLIQCRQNLRNFGIKLIQRENGLALGGVQVKSNFTRRGKGMDHRRDRADAVQGVKSVHSLRRVGHGDGYAVALADTERQQGLGGGLKPGKESAVVRLFAHKLIGDVVGIAPGSVLDHLVHGLVRIINAVRRVAVILQPRGGQSLHVQRTLFLHGSSLKP